MSAFGKFDLFPAEVLERDSRVTILIETGEGRYRAHLRNTGRLEEFIYPGAPVVCEWKEGGKTDARTIGAIDDGAYVLLDTCVQEKAVGEMLEAGALPSFPPGSEIEAQVSCRGKRFDFRTKNTEGDGYIELKSAVTCRDGWASYPDAPSKRGLEHVKLLKELAGSGHDAYVIFVVTHPKCNRFRPDAEIQPEMATELKSAREAGVRVFALKIILTEDGTIVLEDNDIPVDLEGRN